MMAKQWPNMSQMTCSSSMVLCYARQGDSSAYLACFTQWQLTSICCKRCTRLTKAAEQEKKDTRTLTDRKTGSMYLCEPVSVGGPWGVAEPRKKYRMWTGLHRPTPGTFQTLHLQKKKGGKCVFIVESETHTRERCKDCFWTLIVAWPSKMTSSCPV